ncbi:Phospholipase C/P1 nuclease [Mycena sanguinolenta]|uniref:Phospholipase C/P1 nuclease n=1 Tax=Mycena sanguinolenta TaxID=230812 RepID=A0A8H6ZFW8_9AGAR|nr:Phospholipase C/P1 nuclease [Mycena sanguinolenta]
MQARFDNKGDQVETMSSTIVSSPFASQLGTNYSFPTSLAAFWEQTLLVWNRITGGGVMDTDDDLICPYYWATPIHALNCELVWPKALDEPPYNNHTRLANADAHQHQCESESPANELAQVDSAGRFIGGAPGEPYLELDTPQYSGVITKQRIIEKLLAQAGIRLAGVLNYLFADIEDPEEAKLWRSGQGLRIHV